MGENYKKHCIYPAYRRGCFFKKLPEEETFHDNYNAVESTPDYECPVSTVPYARSRPYNRKIEYGAACTLTVSAKGDIYIASEPCTEGHVPASPEFGNAL